MKKAPVHNYSKQTGRKAITAQMASESRLRTQQWLNNGCNGFHMKKPISNPMAFWTEQDVLLYIKEYIQPKLKELVEIASSSSGSLRKKARKELRKYHYNTTGLASVYRDVVIDYDAEGQVEGQMDMSELASEFGIFDTGRRLLKTTGCSRTGCVFCGYGCHLESPEENRFEMTKVVSNPNLTDFCMRGGAFAEDGLWKPDNRGLGYWFVMKWMNVHGGMNYHIPDYEKYEAMYGTEETRRLLKEQEMAKRLTSVLTDDMDHCMFTGSNVVERHHVFYRMGGGMKEKCEKYGFIAPLRPDLHPNGVFAGQSAKLVDTRLKEMCQRYYEEHYGTREEFIEEFGQNYL